MKTTKKNTVSFVKTQLGSNKVWALKALVRIFQENQTDDEQAAGVTRHDNGIGFTGVDAQFLSSLAENYLKYGRLSDKQMGFVFKKMPKYARQLWLIAANKVMAEAAKTTTAPKVELESEPKTTTVAARSSYGYDSRISEWH